MRLLPFVFLVSFLIVFVQMGALTIAFGKLGLSQHSAFLLLFASLFGSAINLHACLTLPPCQGVPCVP